MNIIKSTIFTAAVFVLNPVCLFSQSNNSSDTINIPALKVINNPIIQGLGVCDPHIHIFNNKAYLFASHDESPGNTFYVMKDWWVWSSPDLVHWNLEFNLLPKDMWVGITNNCWAVDGVGRNGKYYFYVSGNWKTGIALSTDGPGGPYKDALKTYIGNSYDPTVFVDDDANKTPYLMTGGFPYKIAKLNEDMISLAEEQKDILHTSVSGDGDGGFLHKHNGLYYLNGHGTTYSTATNIYGPYTKRNNAFYKHWIDHPTMFTWNNQSYCAYGLGDVDKYFRKTHITYLHYKSNGDMYADEYIAESHVGVGQYDCSKNIQAEWYFAASDGTNKQEGGSGFIVRKLTNNAYLYYQRMLNVAEDATISVNISSSNDKGVIEVRKDKTNGPLLGTIKIPNTGGLEAYQTASTKLKCKTGLQNIYLVFTGKDVNANLDWLSISSTAPIPAPPKIKPIIKPCVPSPTAEATSAFQQIEAENCICFSSVQTEDSKDTDGGKIMAFIKDLSNCAFKVDFGQKLSDSISFQARAASPNSNGGNIEIRLDSITGPLMGTCKIISTGGWQNWVTQECKVGAVSGDHNLFLVFRGGEEYLFNLNWIKFALLDNALKP